MTALGAVCGCSVLVLLQCAKVAVAVGEHVQLGQIHSEFIQPVFLVLLFVLSADGM